MQPAKDIVGVVEKVTIIGNRRIDVYALFDTGAKQSSIDLQLASEIGLGPVIGTKTVKQASSKRRVMRPVVSAKIKIFGRVIRCKVNLEDRSHMKFPVIIGRNINSKFLIDPSRNAKLLRVFGLKDTSEIN